jgi:hypothetical protein
LVGKEILSTNVKFRQRDDFFGATAFVFDSMEALRRAFYTKKRPEETFKANNQLPEGFYNCYSKCFSGPPITCSARLFGVLGLMTVHDLPFFLWLQF